MAPVGFDDALANRQPQPRASSLAISALDAIKLVENALTLAHRDAYALIGHLEADRFPVTLSPDVNGRLRGGVFGRILQQIDQHMLGEDKIEAQHGQRWIDLDDQLMLAERSGQP
jgi:hypothetical protein